MKFVYEAPSNSLIFIGFSMRDTIRHWFLAFGYFWYDVLPGPVTAQTCQIV